MYLPRVPQKRSFFQMKSTFSFSVGKIKLYAEITECYNTYYYIMDGSKFVIGRQMSATGRI